MRGVVARSVVAAAGILLLAGCAGAQPLEPDTVAVIAPQGSGMDALLVGALTLGEDCVTVTTPDGVVTPVFPTSLVAWDGDALRIDGETYDDGDPVWLGGGFIVESGDRDAPSDIHLPPGCPTDDVFLVAG